MFSKKKGIVFSEQDTEIDNSPSSLSSSALSVEGEVKELKSMLAEMLWRLDPGNTPLGSKFCGRDVQGSKRKPGC